MVIAWPLIVFPPESNCIATRLRPTMSLVDVAPPLPGNSTVSPFCGATAPQPVQFPATLQLPPAAPAQRHVFALAGRAIDAARTRAKPEAKETRRESLRRALMTSS